MTLVYNNKTEQDILLKKELEALAQQYPQKLKVFFNLTRVDSWENGSTGKMTTEFLRDTVGIKNHPDEITFHCGTKLMNKSIKELLLTGMGLPEEQIFKY